MNVTSDQRAWIDSAVIFEGSAHIGFSSCVGYGPTDDGFARIGDGLRVGAFCIVEHGAHIEASVEIDHYCRIASGAHICAQTRILYGAQIFNDVRVGHKCIIGGDLVDRTIIGDNVTFQGNTSHSHKNPTGDWDETEEPSPIIEHGSVVGIGALLIGGISSTLSNLETGAGG